MRLNKYIIAVYNNLIFFGVSTIFFLVITPVAIRVMGDDFFGLWSILYAILVLSNIGTLGIASIITKFAAEVRPDDPAREKRLAEILTGGALIVLLMSVIVASVYLGARTLIAGWLAIDPQSEARFSQALIPVALSVFPLFLSKVIQGFLLARLETRLVRQIDISTSIVLWLGVVLVVKLFGRDLLLAGLWCLFYAVLVFALYCRALLDRLRFRFRFDPVRVRGMLSFSGFLFIESVAIALFQQADRLIVGITLGPALAGVYAVGTGLGLRMSMVVGQVTDVMIPYASLKDSLDERSGLYLIFCRLSRYISLFVASLGGVLVLWMDEILSLWISPAYAASYGPIFRLFIVGYGLLSLSRPAHQTLTGIGRVRVTAFIYSASTIAMLIALYVLSIRFGFTGAALANLVPVLLLLMNLYVYRSMAGRSSLQDLFADLKWGVCVPLLVFAFMLLGPSIWLKLLMTLLLGVLFGVVLFKDEWAQPWLVNQLKRVRSRFDAYA